jgi:hypothetical protein
MKYGLVAIDHQRVAGIVAALIAYDYLRLISQQINNLALTFITPLGA